MYKSYSLQVLSVWQIPINPRKLQFYSHGLSILQVDHDHNSPVNSNSV